MNKQEKQVQENFTAFKKMFPDLPENAIGKFALMRDGEIIEYFDTAGDALKYGQLKYKSDGLFSIQKVTNHIVDLGYFSHVNHIQAVQPQNWSYNSSCNISTR